MKPFGILLATGTLSLALVACDSSTPNVAETSPAQAGSPAPVEDVPPPADSDISETQPQVPAQPAASNAPAFATLYPGAALSQPVVTARGPDGPGGIAEFTTSATPDEVISFYRDAAAKTGLKPVMSMNQGDARAFAALNSAGAEVQVVASPNSEGATSVQLTWKAGL